MIEPIDPDGRTLVRGKLMRGWSSVLKQRGLLEAVALRLTPEVAALLREPPGPTEWVDAAHFECVAQAVLEEVGEQRLDALLVEAQSAGWVTIISRFAHGIVRVFGASPGGLFKHVPSAGKTTTVGVVVRWEEHGPNGGELIAEYPFRKRIHPASAWGTSAVCQIVSQVVGVPVTRERPVIEPMGRDGTRVRIRVRW